MTCGSKDHLFLTDYILILSDIALRSQPVQSKCGKPGIRTDQNDVKRNDRTSDKTKKIRKQDPQVTTNRSLKKQDATIKFKILYRSTICASKDT